MEFRKERTFCLKGNKGRRKERKRKDLQAPNLIRRPKIDVPFPTPCCRRIFQEKILVELQPRCTYQQKLLLDTILFSKSTTFSLLLLAFLLRGLDSGETPFRDTIFTSFLSLSFIHHLEGAPRRRYTRIQRTNNIRGKNGDSRSAKGHALVNGCANQAYLFDCSKDFCGVENVELG